MIDDFGLRAEHGFDLFGQIDKRQADRWVDLNKNVHISDLSLVDARVGAEYCQTPHAEPTGQLGFGLR